MMLSIGDGARDKNWEGPSKFSCRIILRNGTIMLKAQLLNRLIRILEIYQMVTILEHIYQSHNVLTPFIILMMRHWKG